MPKIIILAGGTGLIGTRLTTILQSKGYTVRILTRNPRQEGQYQWNPYAGTIDHAVFKDADAIINLAGSGITDKRWSVARKKDLINSRVKSIETLQIALSELSVKPPVFVSASAVGIYGNSGEYMQTETTSIQQGRRDFMVECCDLWEKAADTVAELGIRTVKIRIGVVLDKRGGALKEMAKPLYFGIGAYFADGKAWMPWIHIEDICKMFVWAVENPTVTGVYNGVSPQSARNISIVQAAARAMGRRWAIIVSAPIFMLRLMLGEMSAVVLNSNRVSAEKAEKAGFEFEYSDLKAAMMQIWR